MKFDTGDIISAVMMIVGISTFIIGNVRASKKQTEEEQKEMYSLREGIFKANIKLEQICSTTNETRSDIKAMDQKVIHQGEEIAVIKRDLETAFMRIDELRENKEDKR